MWSTEGILPFLSLLNADADFLQNAILWQQTPVDDHRLTLYASQHFGSYERVNDSAFYLNNDDSRPLYNHVFFDDPVNFPLTPGPVPMFNRPNEPPGGTQSTSGMGQQPGRRMPARRGVSGRGRLSTQENRSPMRTQDRLVRCQSLNSSSLYTCHISSHIKASLLLFVNVLILSRMLKFGPTLLVSYVRATTLLGTSPLVRMGMTARLNFTLPRRTAMPSELSYNEIQIGTQVHHQKP